MSQRLPSRPFFYTVDQIAGLCQVVPGSIKSQLHFVGRTPGVADPKKLKAVNIAGDDEKPIWRVEEREFLRWLKHRGVTYYPPYIGRSEGVGEPDDAPVSYLKFDEDNEERLRT